MKYYIIAGEASGDLHGSNLIKGLRAKDPQCEIRFWGGDMMAAAAGTPPVVHYKDGAIMGFVEVFLHAGKLLGNVKRCKHDILEWKPDAVILIDYPGFNFKIAEFAHSHGFKVFYYIAPKVWASREGRIKKLKKYVDRLFIVFPFEIPYFKAKGIDAIYCGNPLVDAIDGSAAMNESREDFLKRNNLPDKPYIAMLAGSRKGEIDTMMPVLTRFADRLHSIPEYSDYRFIIAGAPSRSMEDYAPYLNLKNTCRKNACQNNGDADIRVIFGETQSVIRNAEAAIINSGTASLEAVLLGTPQVVGYILGSRLTYWIGRLIVKSKFISLGNLIADRLVFRELIQDECNAEALSEEIRRLLEDTQYRKKMLDGYAAIKQSLGNGGASEAVAEAMVRELTPR